MADNVSAAEIFYLEIHVNNTRFETEGAKYAASTLVTDYEYRQDINAWLRLHIVPASWRDAALRCYMEGGILASPTNSTMAAAMTEIMSAHKLSSRAVFTGIHALNVKGDFVTLDGVPLANISLEWAVNEPDNVNNSEDCLAMTGAGALADVSCAGVYPYFCRKEVARTATDTLPVANSNKCGTKTNGYELEPLTGSCYKFHSEHKTWVQAYKVCHQEGGHLAVINSEIEAEVLRKILDQHPEKELNCEGVLMSCNYIAIGLWRLDQEEWMTVLGETLTEAGFNSWEKGEPNNQSWYGPENCGSLRRSGKLNDVSCSKRIFTFICETTPYMDNVY